MIGIVLYVVKRDGHDKCGIHGYAYETTKPKKGIGISKVVLTQLGYKTKDDTIYKEDTTIDDIKSDTLYQVDLVNYINCACAGIPALIADITKEYNPEYLVVNTTTTDIDIPKADKYIQVTPDTQHEVGYTEADKLATIAIYKDITTNTRYPTDDTYFRNESRIHPLLLTERLFFNPYTDDYNRPRYYLGNIGDVSLKPGEVKERHLGKELADAALSVVDLTTKDPVISAIKEYQRDLLDKLHQNLNVVVSVNISNVKDSATYNRILHFNKDSFITASYVKTELYSETKPITYILNPPYLSMRSLMMLELLEDTFDKYLNNTLDTNRYETKDITTYFYTDSSLNDSIADANAVVIDNIRLSPGIDTPNTFALKKLEQYHPTLTLLIDKVDEYLHTYSVIVALDSGERAIYKAPYSAESYQGLQT